MYGDSNIGAKLAFTLCIGGNDFNPKFHGISHGTILRYVFENVTLRNQLVSYKQNQYYLNSALFTELVKQLYTPKRFRNSRITYEDVRAISIGKVEDSSNISGIKNPDPRKWLPPKSAIEKLSTLIQLKIDYLQTAGTHDAQMPDCLKSGCLGKTHKEKLSSILVRKHILQVWTTFQQ